MGLFRANNAERGFALFYLRKTGGFQPFHDASRYIAHGLAFWISDVMEQASSWAEYAEQFGVKPTGI